MKRLLYTFSLLVVSHLAKAETFSFDYKGQLIYSSYAGSQYSGDDYLYFKSSNGDSFRTYQNGSTSMKGKSNLEESYSFIQGNLNWQLTDTDKIWSNLYVNADGEVRVFGSADFTSDDWTAQIRLRVTSESAGESFYISQEEKGIFYLQYANVKAIHTSGFYIKYGSAMNTDLYFQGYEVIDRIGFRQINTKSAVMTSDNSFFQALHLGYKSSSTYSEIYGSLTDEDAVAYNNGSIQQSTFKTNGVCVINNGGNYHRNTTQRCYNPSFSSPNEIAEGDEQTMLVGARSYGKAVSGTGFYYGAEINYFKNSVIHTSSQNTPTSDALLTSLGIAYRFSLENSQMLEPYLNINNVLKHYDDMYTASTSTSGVDGRGSGYNQQTTLNLGLNMALPGGLLDLGYINIAFIRQRFDDILTITEGTNLGEQYGYKHLSNGIDIIYAKGFTKMMTGYAGAGASKIKTLDDYSVVNDANFSYNELNIGLGLVAKF